MGETFQIGDQETSNAQLFNIAGGGMVRGVFKRRELYWIIKPERSGICVVQSIFNSKLVLIKGLEEE